MQTVTTSGLDIAKSVFQVHGSGGKDRLGSISKQGDRYLRSLFMAGALAVIRYAKIRRQQRRNCHTKGAQHGSHGED